MHTVTYVKDPAIEREHDQLDAMLEQANLPWKECQKVQKTWVDRGMPAAMGELTAAKIRLKAMAPTTARAQLLEQLARAAEMVDQKQPNEAADAVLQQCVRQLEQMAGMTGHGTAKLRDDQAPVRTKAQKFDLQAAIRGDYGPGDLTL